MKNFIFILLFFIPLNTYGQMPHSMGYGRHSMKHRGQGTRFFIRHLEQAAKGLNLSKTQIKKIQALNLNFEKKEIQVLKNMEIMKLDLKKLLLEKNVDLKKVRAQLVKLSMQHVEKRMLGIEHRINVEKILTGDQKMKLKLFFNSRRHRHGHSMRP
ncbi:MAG: hypothetical protein JXR95_06640 [Deltaproteobacteria bacterium]|nr:hypothetical protein [Deltaproteobacteria bacterium]